jgi:nitrogen regulatory protein P-II 1
MKKIEAIIKPFKLDEIKEVLGRERLRGMTISAVEDFGRQKGHIELYRGSEYMMDVLPKIKIEVVVEDDEVKQVTDTIVTVLRTGHLCDGEISVLPMEAVLRIRTGERS